MNPVAHSTTNIEPNPVNNNIVVRFHNKIDTPLNLIIPERYTVHTQGSEDDNESRMSVTTDRRMINPQMCTVAIGNEYHIEHIKTGYTNEVERNLLLSQIIPIKTGTSYFLYYGAYECAKWIDEEHGLIPSSHCLFEINPVKMLPGIYLCEEIQKDAPKTASGIYTTPEMASVDGLRVKVIYSGGDIKPGDTIITTDSAQYKLIFEGRQYLLVKEKYIAGVNEHPYGENLLIEYLPEENPERDARNEQKRRQKDFMDSHRMFYEAKDFEPEPMPKFVSAVVIEGKYKGCEVIVERGYGVGVAKNRAIIPPDNLVAVKHAVA